MEKKRGMVRIFLIFGVILALTGCQSNSVGTGEITGTEHSVAESDSEVILEENLLSLCWRQAIESASGTQNRSFILCLPDVSSVELEREGIDYFLSQTEKLRGEYVWNGSELVWNWRYIHSSMCSESYYEKAVSGSPLLMKGNVRYEDNENLVAYSDRASARKLCTSVLGYAGKLYEEANGGIEGSWYAAVYLTDYNEQADAPGGECWLRLGDEDPVRVTVVYEPEGDIPDGSEYSFTVDESAVFDEDTAATVRTTCSFLLTTEKQAVDWMSSAWADFDNYEESRQTEIIDQFYCSGFADCVGYGSRFPSMDYDGDGLTDRVYKHYEPGKGNEIWMFFGDGGTLLLSEGYDGDSHGNTQSWDFDGDGASEVVYTENVWNSAGGYQYIGLWKKTDGEWSRIPLWGEQTGYRNQERLALLGISLRVEKLNNNELRATQPDTGATGTVWVSDDMMPYTWYGDSNIEDSVITGGTSYLLTDPDTGESKIRVYGSWGFKGELIDVIWELIYREGQWILGDCLVESDTNIWENTSWWQLGLDEERTKAGLKDPESLGDLLGTTDIGGSNLYFSGLGRLSYQFGAEGTTRVGFSELPYGELSEITAYLTEEDVLAGEPKTVKLSFACENDIDYVVMEYKGEKLYWRVKQET